MDAKAHTQRLFDTVTELRIFRRRDPGLRILERMRGSVDDLFELVAELGFRPGHLFAWTFGGEQRVDLGPFLEHLERQTGTTVLLGRRVASGWTCGVRDPLRRGKT
jgi:hypothetical protein